MMLKDKVLQQQLDLDGFVVIDLLSENEVAACITVFHKSDESETSLRYNTLEVVDYKKRQFVHNELKSILTQPIFNIFEGYKFIGFNFAVKKAKGASFHSHIDDAHTTDQFRGFNFWIPLIDVDENNGALYVLKRSHLLPLPIRGIGLPFPFLKFEGLIQKYATRLKLRAGQALVFDDRIIHGSPENPTDIDRPAIITGLIPQNAQAQIFVKHNELSADEAELFEASDDFYLSFDIGKRPVGFKSLGVFKYKHSTLTEKQFLAIIQGGR